MKIINNMKKDLRYLNSKWWYRLLKVVFVGMFLLGTIISVIIVVNDNKPYQVKDYKISCIAEYTNKKTLFAEKDAGLYFFPYETETVYQSITDDNRLKLRNICGFTNDKADELNNEAIAYINEQIKLGTDKTTIQKYLDDSRAYTIEEVYRTEGGYVAVVAYSLLTIIISLIIAELVRRIFYYITLGSFLPENPKKYLFFKVKQKLEN